MSDGWGQLRSAQRQRDDRVIRGGYTGETFEKSERRKRRIKKRGRIGGCCEMVVCDNTWISFYFFFITS